MTRFGNRSWILKVDPLTDFTCSSAVVLTGAGRAFSAGGDLDFLIERTQYVSCPTPQPFLFRRFCLALFPIILILSLFLSLAHRSPATPNVTTMKRFYDRFLSVRSLPVPVIAAINGPAIGAGMCLAGTCLHLFLTAEIHQLLVRCCVTSLFCAVMKVLRVFRSVPAHFICLVVYFAPSSALSSHCVLHSILIRCLRHSCDTQRGQAWLYVCLAGAAPGHGRHTLSAARRLSAGTVQYNCFCFSRFFLDLIRTQTWLCTLSGWVSSCGFQFVSAVF